MATITSIASGNFSSTATWSGGVVPGAADTAVAGSGHTIIIDVNTTCIEIRTNSSGTFTINPGVTLTANVVNATNGNTNRCLRFLSASPAVAYIVGNCTGISSGWTAAYAVENASTGTLSITGNVVGSASSASPTVFNTSTGVINITGSVTGGTGGTGATNSSTGTMTITGNVTAGSGASGASNSSTGTMTVIGTITATNGANGFVSSNSAAITRLSGSFISSANGTAAVYAVKYYLNTTPTIAKTRYALDGISTYVDMFTADNTGLGQASPSDVRSGVSYASGALTGTLAVPAAGSVALGVPVDATTGTAILTQANVQTALTAQGLTTARAGNLDNLDAQVSLIPTDVRTELTPELTEITETHTIHGLKTGSPLNVTPTTRTAGTISQAITGDGVTTTTVTR